MPRQFRQLTVGHGSALPSNILDWIWWKVIFKRHFFKIRVIEIERTTCLQIIDQQTIGVRLYTVLFGFGTKLCNKLCSIVSAPFLYGICIRELTSRLQMTVIIFYFYVWLYELEFDEHAWNVSIKAAGFSWKTLLRIRC